MLMVCVAVVVAVECVNKSGSHYLGMPMDNPHFQFPQPLFLNYKSWNSVVYDASLILVNPSTPPIVTYMGRCWCWTMESG